MTHPVVPNLPFWRSQIPSVRPTMLGEFPDQRDLIMFVQRGHRTTYQGPEKSYILRWEGRWPAIKAERLYISLFVPDPLLEEIWADLRTWTRQVKHYNAYAVMGVSYSVWVDDPLPVQLYNLWRVRFTERYLQDHGVRVIPTLDCSPILRELTVATLPPYLPAAAIDMQVSIKQGSVAALWWQTYGAYLADTIRIDALFFNGIQSRENRLQVLKQGVAARHLFGSWGYDYRELLAKKRLLPRVPTQRRFTT
jgi:hypothetical protein